MYSSSSVVSVSSAQRPTLPFSDFLSESLELVRADVPFAYQMLCQRLGTIEVLVSVDGERCVLFCHEEALQVLTARCSSADIDLSTSRETILMLLRGESGLVDAIWNGKVRLRGDLPTLVRFSGALDAYLRGCIRCPNIPGLLARFRGQNERKSE